MNIFGACHQRNEIQSKIYKPSSVYIFHISTRHRINNFQFCYGKHLFFGIKLNRMRTLSLV